MGIVRRFRNEILLFLFLSALYFIFRLIFLDRLPIFTDEAIYVRWAQIALNDSSWRFISLTDGKQPMFVWVAIVFMKLVEDPLIAGRLVSVASGFFTMLGLWFLTNELFKNRKIAFFASTLYVFYPFAQVLDRMALYDSMVATFFIWALYFSVLLVRKLRLDIAYTLGFVIGAGVLTKTINFFNIYLLPLTLILFEFGKKPVLKNFLRWVLLAIFSVGIASVLYNVLRLSPLFEMIKAKDTVFVYPFSEWLTHPFTFFVGNLHGLISWLFEYLKIPYLLLILVSLVRLKDFTREKILLISYFILPFVALALFGKVIFPRFIFFMSLMLLPLAGDGINFASETLYRKLKVRIDKRLFVSLVVFIFVLYPGFVSLQFAYDPINAKIAKADNSQYVNSWAAGWGVRESVNLFKEKAKDGPIYIATQGTFGLMPEAMEMYLLNEKNITVKGYWPVDDVAPELIELSKKMPVYFIFYQKEYQIIPPGFPLKLLLQVRQGNNDSFYRIYQVSSS